MQPDEIRVQQREAWNRSSAGWDRWDHIVLPMIAEVGAEMVRSLELRPDATHLDISCGTGEPGLTIASLVPEGRVVLTDPAEAMVDIARRNAEDRGLGNVEFRVCGADDLPFADDTFDSLSCRFGFMFFPDIAAAAREMARVLRPGGRISVAVWAGPAGNPWATIPLARIGAEVELPAPAPDLPGLFRCAAPGAIAAEFALAGLTDVVETDVRDVLVTPSAEEYWQYMMEISAPVIAAMELVDPAARDRVRDGVLEDVRAFAVDGSPRIPLHARCISATG